MAQRLPSGPAIRNRGARPATYAYVGSFTTAKRKARGDGIHVYRSDAATGVWTHLQHIGELTNPSFLALSPDQRFLYSVHGDSDYASAFALDRQTGQTRLLNHAATGGNNGVRQAVDPSGRYLLVANYAQDSRRAADLAGWLASGPTSAAPAARGTRAAQDAAAKLGAPRRRV